jgi:hypothetical protein
VDGAKRHLHPAHGRDARGVYTYVRTYVCTYIVNLAEQLTSSDFGISTGLINQNYWENSKWYYVNVERGNTADKLNGRNINVSFTNNS